jgi:hypothetical protein
MEGSGENGRRTGLSARTKRGLVIEVWVGLGRAAVGENELREVQRAIARRFGESAVDSPASIARLLADEGAELRHPEIIEFDARWRQTQIEMSATDSSVFDPFDAAKPLRLKRAEALIKKFEKLRTKFEQAGDERAMKSLKDGAISARRTVQSLAKSERLSQRVRGEQIEIAEWLSVWIRTPTLFAEWLELRQRSPDFRQQFPQVSHKNTEAQRKVKEEK